MSLHQRIADCTICAANLPHGPRPVVQFSPTSRVLIIGQAPGSKVHASGIPWDDPSGDRLREWTGLDNATFYDPAKVALVPMGFCYPGKGDGGDLPPRPECAPQWHAEVLGVLPETRLTLLVGSYAQAHYLPQTRKLSLTKRVEQFEDFLPRFLPLPHPSWRSTLFMRKNPWFEADVVPALQRAIATQIQQDGTHGTQF
ncbi:uracil-DNA glycosylase family protein [Parerythrobacter jejuensis]|uniref:Uracil-DNA glycosylase family protein n=1 Tax=Parerythrobacter jejuensis TaxID=795812 RepID=A0A845AT44_9SPHN|nr:uracil-DNA glycosylase family protein [Parerythrobacter jejuensis]MXP32011.1 uracil-DNA glycosylase family protein [Parerythrobacter jejuensis]